MQLSVAMITRHRPLMVQQIVQQLLLDAAAYDPAGSKVRIYVSDSSEDERTQDILKPMAASACGRLILLRASESYDSGENHLYDALKKVVGKYVWTLADDEIIKKGAFSNIFQILEGYNPDIILLNPEMVSFDGATILHKKHVPDKFFNKSGAIDFATTYKEITKKIGLIHLTALISAIVCNREILLSADWERYLELSPLYAHGMCQLESFYDLSAVYSNRDIIAYRMGAEDYNNTETFNRVAEKRGVSNEYFFQASLVEFLINSIRQGIYKPKEAIEITEVHWEHGSFYLLQFITWSMSNVLRKHVNTSESAVPAHELDKVQELLKYVSLRFRVKIQELIGISRLAYSRPSRGFDHSMRQEICGRVDRLQTELTFMFSMFGVYRDWSYAMSLDGILQRLPVTIHKRVAEFVSTIGMKYTGMNIYGQAERRSFAKI